MTWSLARMLLLLSVMTGVIGMHTLGHPSGHDQGSGPSSGPSSGHVMIAEDPGVAVRETAFKAAPQVLGDPETGTLMNPLNVCLAILGAGLLLLLVAMMRRLRFHRSFNDGTALVHRRPARAPPLAPAFGLTLADLSVQRT